MNFMRTYAMPYPFRANVIALALFTWGFRYIKRIGF